MTNQNDPLDRLGEGFGRVPSPDQWNEIVARSEDAASAGSPAAPTSNRHAGWLVGAAAAAVVVLVGGVVLIRDRDTSAPVATQPGETVPAPAPALPCESESDLAAIVALLGSGTERLAYGQQTVENQQGSGIDDGHVALLADAASIVRVEEWRRLELGGSPRFFKGDGPVDAVSERAPWDSANGPDPLAEPVYLDNVRVVAVLHSLSSAQVWSPGVGELIVGCAGTDVPAIDIHNGMTLLGDPSIDEIAELMADPQAAPPVRSTPPTAPTSSAPTSAPPPATAMPCASDADLDAVRALLRTGLPDFEYDPAEGLAELLERSDVAFRATLAGTSLGAADSTDLRVTDVRVLVGDDVDISHLDLTSAWAGVQAADPLESTVTFDGLEMVVFARRVPGLSTGWMADAQGVFIACTTGSSYVRPLLDPASFLDHSSLDALADQIAVGARVDSGPWGRPCTDQAGQSEAHPSDPLAERPFGPLAPNPGLTILYPLGVGGDQYGDPVSSVTRVPGGLLIRLQASGPDGSDRIVAVVDDDGSVRWRRCIPDSYGWSAVVDDDVVHLEVTTDDGSNASEWWSFDLATGESTVDPSPPAEMADAPDWPPDVFFHFDDGVQSPLGRRTDDGRELWRRDDLFDPGGEGFRASEIQPTESGPVVLVRACVGARIGETSADEAHCPYALLGIDADDGSTIWQIDGHYSVPLVADGWAIVNNTGTGGFDTSVLIDLATGEPVADGVSAAPGAFYEECCGGYEYNRVEAAGALAWTVAFDRLNVWFPADAPMSGATVDLLGPAGEPTVFARLYMPVYDVPGCGVNCRNLRATGAGFPPGATVRAECLTDRDGEWAPLAEPVDVVVSADGSLAISNLCADGRDDGNVKVVVNGVESNTLTGG